MIRSKKLNDSDMMLRAEHTVSQVRVKLSASHPVRLQHIDLDEDTRIHDHDYTEICLILRGRVDHHTEAGTETCNEGSVIVAQPGAVHGFSRPSNASVLNIYFLSEWLLHDLRYLWDVDELVSLFLATGLFRMSRTVPTTVFSFTDREREVSLYEIDTLEKELDQDAPSPLYIKSCFTKLLIQLSRSYHRHASRFGTRRAGLDFRPEVRAMLEQTERLIEDGKPFDLGALSGTTGFSAEYASKLFKEASGWPPQEYYQRRRVQHACNRLLNPSQTIGDIVYDLGYSDAAHFSRTFKRVMGISPKVYRARFLTA